jgi:hypothetical protein
MWPGFHLLLVTRPATRKVSLNAESWLSVRTPYSQPLAINLQRSAKTFAAEKAAGFTS